MNLNFGKDIKDLKEDELLRLINNNNPSFGMLASDELTRRSLESLNKTIKDGIIESEKSSEIERKFTTAIFLLTVVQVLVAILQFVLSFAYSDNVQMKIFGTVMAVVMAIVLVYFSKKIFTNNN